MSPLVGQLMATYLCVMQLARPDGAPVVDRHRRLIEIQHQHEVQVVPDLNTCRAIVGNVDRMAAHFSRNLETLLTGAERATIEPDLMPVAGFSCFPRLDLPFRRQSDLVEWSNRFGRSAGWIVNPTLQFGATPAVWETLYPETNRLRLNLSVTGEELVRTLRVLDAAVATAWSVT